MILRQFFDQESYTYSYLIANNGEGIIIDPVDTQQDKYIKLLAELGVSLVYALDTHTHADHITALGGLREQLRCATMHGVESKAACVSARFKDGDSLKFGSESIQVLHTPGHTDDSYSFYLDSDNRKAVFSGDTLLIRGTGRTDFQNGNAAQQYDSIFGKLFALPDDTLVYPGHDYNGMTVSTVGEERKFNPRLQVANKDNYIALMASLDLPDPRLMDIAVPANQACGKT